MRARPSLSRIAVGAGFVAVGIVGLTGILKLWDLNAFAVAVEGWTILPIWLASVAIVVVPIAEIGVLGFWPLGHRRIAASIGLGLVTVFLLASVAQYLDHDPGDCGCLGPLARYIQFSSMLPKMLVLNGSLLICFAGYLITPIDRGRVGSC